MEKCIKDDDATAVYKKLIAADIILFAVPTFRGHLAASYFALSERSQGIFRKEFDYDEDFLKKLNLIIIGNMSSGADMALHEAFYDFTNKPFYPESILLSSREYERRSINGDLIGDDMVKQRLDKFVDMIRKKTSAD